MPTHNRSFSGHGLLPANNDKKTVSLSHLPMREPSTSTIAFGTVVRRASLASVLSCRKLQMTPRTTRSGGYGLLFCYTPFLPPVSHPIEEIEMFYLFLLKVIVVVSKHTPLRLGIPNVLLTLLGKCIKPYHFSLFFLGSITLVCTQDQDALSRCDCKWYHDDDNTSNYYTIRRIIFNYFIKSMSNSPPFFNRCCYWVCH